MPPQLVEQSCNRRFLAKALIWALIIEALSLPPAVLTMGHAGPEGPLAALGWFGLAVNLVGFAAAGKFAPFSSVLRFALAVFVIQVTLVAGIIVLLRWLTSSMRSKHS